MRGVVVGKGRSGNDVDTGLIILLRFKDKR